MENNRLAAGFGWGIVAVLAMSVPMIIGMKTGVAPMPKPIPVALVAKVLGGGPKPLLMVLGFSSHLLYGGIGGSCANTTGPTPQSSTNNKDRFNTFNSRRARPASDSFRTLLAPHQPGGERTIVSVPARSRK